MPFFNVLKSRIFGIFGFPYSAHNIIWKHMFYKPTVHCRETKQNTARIDKTSGHANRYRRPGAAQVHQPSGENISFPDDIRVWLINFL